MAKRVYSLIIIDLNNPKETTADCFETQELCQAKFDEWYEEDKNNPNMEVVYHYNGCYEYTLGDIHNMVVMDKSFCFDKI